MSHLSLVKTSVKAPARILAANWKMNLTAAKAVALAGEIIKRAAKTSLSEIWIAAPFTSLPALSDVCRAAPIALGAQNVFWEDRGAFTGEISVEMLKEHSCSFVIVGHSERRNLFHERPGEAAQRALFALNSGLSVIFCVGETINEKMSGKTGSVVRRQLRPLLSELSNLPENLVIAYEPVWAIGTGVVAKEDDINTAHSEIGSVFAKKFAGASPPILYGGSVTPDNFEAILALPGVNGGLIGGASLIAEKFNALIDIAERI